MTGCDRFHSTRHRRQMNPQSILLNPIDYRILAYKSSEQEVTVMRLIDFNLSTADLQQTLPLYWELTTNQIWPIQSVTLVDHQLVLVASKSALPLTLDQFNARTRQIDGQTQLCIQTPPRPRRLFGYRLSQQRLLFGWASNRTSTQKQRR
mgnify:FL=1